MKKFIAVCAALLFLAGTANATHFGRGFAFQRTTFFTPSYGYAVGGYATYSAPAVFAAPCGIQQTYAEPLVQALPGVSYAPAFAPAVGFAPTYAPGFAFVPSYSYGFRSFAFARTFVPHRTFFAGRSFVGRGFGLGGSFVNVAVGRGIFGRSFVNVNVGRGFNRGIGFSRGFGIFR